MKEIWNPMWTKVRQNSALTVGVFLALASSACGNDEQQPTPTLAPTPVFSGYKVENVLQPPPATQTPIPTPEIRSTPTPTIIPTATPRPTERPRSTPTSTNTPESTRTPTPPPTPKPTEKPTPYPTPTLAPTPPPSPTPVEQQKINLKPGEQHEWEVDVYNPFSENRQRSIDLGFIVSKDKDSLGLTGEGRSVKTEIVPQDPEESFSENAPFTVKAGKKRTVKIVAKAPPWC